MNNKVVLAYSGGLDTSFCAVYLSRERQLEVHSVLVDTGGFSADELQEIEKRAYQMGVTSHQVIDAVEEYYQRCLRFLLAGNVLKNGTYPLSVSAERIIQATCIARYAASVGARYVAHGSTGAGNDQVRFDMIFQILLPEVEIITPIRDRKLSRQQEVEYLQKNGIDFNPQKAKYSVNKGIWGTSVGGAETLNSKDFLPEEAWPTPQTREDEETVKISFRNGEPVALNDEAMQPVQLIRALQQIAAPFGIGRDIHVGDTIIGIKGRVGFEAAAPVILIKAHHTLEKHTLGKWQLNWKDQLASFYGNWLHEGQFLDPVMRDIEQFLSSSQQVVNGSVWVKLYPFRFQVQGIESENDLMGSRFGTYGEMNTGWSGEDVKGFTRIFGNQVRIWHQVNQEK